MPTSFGSDLFVNEINVSRAKIASIDAGTFDPPLPVITPTLEEVLVKNPDANGEIITNLDTLNSENVIIAQSGTIAGNAAGKAVCTNLDLRDASNDFPTKYDQLITDLADLVTRVEALESAMGGGGSKV